MSTATLTAENKPTSKPAPKAQPQAAPQVPPQPPSDRDAKGRFLPGNPGGPGNPFARQVAQIRKRVINRVTMQDIDLMIDTFKWKAIGGDLASAKFLCQYLIGKPAEAVNPDTLDIEEFRQIYVPREEIMKHVNAASGTLDPATCSAMVRFLSALNHVKMADMVSKPPEERSKIMKDLAGAPAANLKPAHEEEDEDVKFDRHIDEVLFGEGDDLDDEDDDLDDEDDYDDKESDDLPDHETAPSTNSGNGQTAPSTKGGNGHAGPSAKGGNGHAGPSPKRGNGQTAPSTKGRNGKHKAGKPTTNGKNRIAFPLRQGSRF